MAKYLNPKADLTFKKVFGDVDPELLNSPITAEALEIVETAAYTPEELEAYNKYWLDISTERSALAESEAKGRAKGRAEGFAEGEAKERAKAYAEKLDMARKMKSMQMSISQISEITGLTADEIANI